MSDQVDVHLYGDIVGALHRTGPETVEFEPEREAIERHGLGSTILSASIPLSARRSGQHASTAFFGGLFPEGRGQTNLAKQAGCHRHDVFSLIDYAGRDVAGAVVVGASDESVSNEYVLLSNDDVAARLDRVNDYALGSVGGGSSLAGFQPKTTLAWLNEQWHAGVDDAPSTHILKPIAPDSERALHTEAYTLALAREAGLVSFNSWIESFAGRPVLAIERYDRKVLPDGTVERIHQEDAAQALALPWNSDAKFEGVDSRANLRNVAGLLPRRKSVFGNGNDDRERLLAYAAFNVAVGNTDAHAKNFSMLHHRDGAITLASLYDISTHALAPDGNQNMAMQVNGKSYQPDIGRQDLIAEGAAWGLDEGTCRTTVDDTLEQLRYAVEDADPGKAPSRVGDYIAVQAQNLLDGKRAGVEGPGPVSIMPFTAPERMPARKQRRSPRGVSGQ